MTGVQTCALPISGEPSSRPSLSLSVSVSDVPSCEPSTSTSISSSRSSPSPSPSSYEPSVQPTSVDVHTGEPSSRVSLSVSVSVSDVPSCEPSTSTSTSSHPSSTPSRSSPSPSTHDQSVQPFTAAFLTRSVNYFTSGRGTSHDRSILSSTTEGPSSLVSSGKSIETQLDSLTADVSPSLSRGLSSLRSVQPIASSTLGSPVESEHSSEWFHITSSVIFDTLSSSVSISYIITLNTSSNSLANLEAVLTDSDMLPDLQRTYKGITYVTAPKFHVISSGSSAAVGPNKIPTSSPSPSGSRRSQGAMSVAQVSVMKKTAYLMKMRHIALDAHLSQYH